MYISFIELGQAVLFILAVIAGGYLIAVLRRLLRVLGQVRDILEDNREPVGRTLSVLPDTLTSVQELAASVKETVEQTSSTVESWQGRVNSTVKDWRRNLESYAFYLNLLMEVLRTVFHKNR